MKGCFIVFEGTEGSGKTAQAILLEKWLRKSKYNVVRTREPTHSNIGSLINQVLEGKIEAAEEAIPLLFAADRANHTKRLIEPALREGGIVLCDRYVFSSLAYQSQGMKTSFRKKWLKEINKYALKPDIVFFLDIDPEKGLKRLKRNERIHDDKFFEDLETQKRIREAYHSIFNLNEPITNFFNVKGMPHSLLPGVNKLSITDHVPVICINGALPKDGVHKTIRRIAQEFLEYKEILPRKRRVKPEEFFTLLRFTEE